MPIWSYFAHFAHAEGVGARAAHHDSSVSERWDRAHADRVVHSKIPGLVQPLSDSAIEAARKQVKGGR